MFWFKSKDKKQNETTESQKQSADQSSAAEDIVVSDTPSLFEVDKLIFKSGYRVYAHDQGRKQLDKKLKNNIK